MYDIAVVSIIAHELAEATTDPDGYGYCYLNGQTSCFGANTVENGDQVLKKFFMTYFF
jgi:hypothetical protein